jgi:chromosome segregation ATPase
VDTADEVPVTEAAADEQPAIDAPWLAELEARVREAVGEIGRLRQDNRRLEKELAKLRKTASGGESAAVAWEQERAAVRERVERLTTHLQSLLGEAPADDVSAAGEASAAAGDRG